MKDHREILRVIRHNCHLDLGNDWNKFGNHWTRRFNQRENNVGSFVLCVFLVSSFAVRYKPVARFKGLEGQNTFLREQDFVVIICSKHFFLSTTKFRWALPPNIPRGYGLGVVARVRLLFQSQLRFSALQAQFKMCHDIILRRTEPRDDSDPPDESSAPSSDGIYPFLPSSEYVRVVSPSTAYLTPESAIEVPSVGKLSVSDTSLYSETKVNVASNQDNLPDGSCSRDAPLEYASYDATLLSTSSQERVLDYAGDQIASINPASNFSESSRPLVKYDELISEAESNPASYDHVHALSEADSSDPDKDSGAGASGHREVSHDQEVTHWIWCVKNVTRFRDSCYWFRARRGLPMPALQQLCRSVVLFFLCMLSSLTPDPDSSSSLTLRNMLAMYCTGASAHHCSIKPCVLHVAVKRNVKIFAEVNDLTERRSVVSWQGRLTMSSYGQCFCLKPVAVQQWACDSLAHWSWTLLLRVCTICLAALCSLAQCFGITSHWNDCCFGED